MLQRLVYPAADVSGGFYEWRTVSRYRGVAGLHLGYDVAMPGGTPSVAGWPGQVTHVAQWYKTEYGVTVLSPSGYETTYGHLSPRVKPGDVVNAGDYVGFVVNDHVDIKMRGPDGSYFDFGHETLPGVFPVPGPTRGEALHLYLTTYYGLLLDREDIKMARRTRQQTVAELSDLRAEVRRTRDDLPRLRQFLADGLVARVDVQKAQSDVNNGAARVDALRLRMRAAQRDLDVREARLGTLGARLALCRRLLQSMGVSESEVQRKLRSPSSSRNVAQARELKEMRDNYKRTVSKHRASDPRAAAKAEMIRMEQLYDQGVVSRMERDRARARFEAFR